jgi:hypothetical protein
VKAGDSASPATTNLIKPFRGIGICSKSFLVDPLKASLAEALNEIQILVFEGDALSTTPAAVVEESGPFVPIFRGR